MIVFLLSLGLVCLVSIILASISIGVTSQPIRVRQCEIITSGTNASNGDYWEIKIELSNKRIDYNFYSEQLHNISRIAIIGPYVPEYGWNTTKNHINILYKPYVTIDKETPFKGSATSEYVSGVAIHPVHFNKKVEEVIDFPPRYSLLITTEVEDIQIQIKDSC